jgi:hypothetical protein
MPSQHIGIQNNYVDAMVHKSKLDTAIKIIIIALILLIFLSYFTSYYTD